MTTKIVKDAEAKKMEDNGAPEFESPSYWPAPWRRTFFTATRTQQQKAKWQLPFLSIHVDDSFLLSFLLAIFIPTNHNDLLNDAGRKRF
jgi:hypothetical protein